MARKDAGKTYQESLEERKALLEQIVSVDPKKALDMFIDETVNGEALMAARRGVPHELVLDKIDEIIAAIRSKVSS